MDFGTLETGALSPMLTGPVCMNSYPAHAHGAGVEQM